MTQTMTQMTPDDKQDFVKLPHSSLLPDQQCLVAPVIPFLVTEQRLGWTPKRQWPPLHKRSVDSIHLSSSFHERLRFSVMVKRCRRIAQAGCGGRYD